MMVFLFVDVSLFLFVPVSVRICTMLRCRPSNRELSFICIHSAAAAAAAAALLCVSSTIVSLLYDIGTCAVSQQSTST